MKDKNEVIEEFNELINMTASDLEAWLKSDDSRSAGWPKEDGAGESVGHDSGRKIVEILKSNPDKEPEKYTDDQVQHMRKVVSYCKRHLAQEEKIDNEKSVEELKKTKSYASLKNWGHDILKKRGKTEETEEKQTGDKRKATGGQGGKNKKRETRKGEADGADNGGDEEDDGEEEEELEEVDEEDDEEEDEEEDDGQDEKTQNKSSNRRKTRSQDAKSNGNNKQDESKDEDKIEEEDDGEEEEADDDKGSNGVKGPKKGDTVSWNWGGGQPEGKVLDVKPEETTITTKKGNKVSRKGDEEDPAVVLDAGSSKAIKLNHELN